MAPLPPGPRSRLWTMVRYVRDPMGVMPAMVERYGDPFTIPGPTPLVCCGEPDGIKAIYSAPPDTFEPATSGLEVLLGEQALIVIGGPEHRRKRRLMMPPFAGACMRGHGDSIARLVRRRTADWVPGRTVSMASVAQHLSLDVILAVIFGVEGEQARAELSRQLLETLESFSPILAIVPALQRPLLGLSPYARFMRRQRALHARLDALVVEARAAPERTDVLGRLLQARDEDGEPLSDEDVRAQLVLLVLAGHETTAVAIAWAIHALHQPENDAVLQRLREALDELGPAPSVDELARLPYLDAVCKETLRRYPLAPAPAPRRLLRPLEIPGYRLPAGIDVSAAIGAAHMRPATYPEPLKFDPERFSGRKLSPFEWLPYGGGARRCLGAALADYELRIAVGTIIRDFGLRLASTRPDPGRVRAANVGPAHGVRVIVEERRRAT